MSAEPVRILLIEDNDADVYLFRTALESAELNCELIVIEDGAEALAFVRHEGKHAGSPLPDLAVLDLNLPKNEGTEVLEAIRQNKNLSNLPVVVVTSSALPREQAKTEQLGVARFITKPTDLADFLQIGMVLKQVLAESQARRHSPAS